MVRGVCTRCPGLPPDWFRVEAEGETYYWNKRTAVTTFDAPTPERESDATAGDDAGEGDDDDDDARGAAAAAAAAASPADPRVRRRDREIAGSGRGDGAREEIERDPTGDGHGDGARARGDGDGPRKGAKRRRAERAREGGDPRDERDASPRDEGEGGPDLSSVAKTHETLGPLLECLARDDETTAAAARCGQLSVLKWLRANAFPWNERTCVDAARHGQFDVMRWARANGAPWDQRAVTRAAMEGGRDEIAAWARAEGANGAGAGDLDNDRYDRRGPPTRPAPPAEETRRGGQYDPSPPPRDLLERAIAKLLDVVERHGGRLNKGFISELHAEMPETIDLVRRMKLKAFCEASNGRLIFETVDDRGDGVIVAAKSWRPAPAKALVRVDRYQVPNAVVECPKCGDPSHHVSRCPLANCRSCGRSGHLRGACPDATCFRCGKRGHESRFCRERPNPSSGCLQCGSREHFLRDCPDVGCFHCGEFGHRRDECPRRRRGPW